MGTPQGTWSLVMTNLYDMKVNRSCKLVRYADNLTLYVAFSKSDRSTIPAFQLALDQIAEWAMDNNMLENASKT